MQERTEAWVEGKPLQLSNLNKIFYPAVGFTKAQVIDYYRQIAPVLLPHLRNHPLTLKRYPNGVEGEYFYEKNCPRHRPDWVPTAPVWSEGNQREMQFCMANDLPTLIWAANLANLELHTSLSNYTNLDRPTVMAFDLDPGLPAALLECCRVALLLRDLFASLDLDCFVKTSGSKGIQVYVPLNTPVSYADTKAVSRAIAELLEKRHPGLVVSNMRKSLRHGKVLVDWSQNDAHKTTVSVYSLRAKEVPTVSTPVEWSEVENAVKRGTANGLIFQADEVLQRVAEKGDLFAPVLILQQKMPAIQ
jgi:bifunctional non-homologous end joining protein LigD